MLSSRLATEPTYGLVGNNAELTKLLVLMELGHKCGNRFTLLKVAGVEIKSLHYCGGWRLMVVLDDYHNLCK